MDGPAPGPSDRVRTRTLRAFLLLIIAAVVVFLIPTPAVWVEHFYSRRLYLLGQNLLTPVSGLVPVAVFDLLILAVVGGVGAFWFRALRRAAPGRRWRVAGRLVFHTVALTAALYLVFVAFWGLNYRRQPLTVTLEYDPSTITSEALIGLTFETIGRLNELHPRTRGESWPELRELPDRMGGAFGRIQRELGGGRLAVTGRPKPTLLTSYFKRAGIDGMVNPFALEVLVNTSVLPFERPFVVAHEWAHLAGYANESEASFVGWLTCLDGDDQTRYSAWIFLIPHLMRHLAEPERERMWSRMEEGPLDDLRAVSARLSHAVPVVRRNATRVYDRFLRANRLREGVASYGAVVNLVLGTTVGRDRS